ncbi:hypothetical protein HMPREF1366_00918 [Enterococcus faecium ERV26]|nr:hypothetical protein HMPREF1366_00918 [Enterococcus faecium ERV26]
MSSSSWSKSKRPPEACDLFLHFCQEISNFGYFHVFSFFHYTFFIISSLTESANNRKKVRRILKKRICLTNPAVRN